MIRKQKVVMCLLIAGVLCGKFTHASDACQSIDGAQNDSECDSISLNISTYVT